MRNQWLDDITSRIAEPPSWWLAGIPRYCEYHPTRFFAAHAQALVRVRCIGCYQAFDVAWGLDTFTGISFSDSEIVNALDRYYEHPPRHNRATTGFSCAGNNAGVELWAILQVWQRGGTEWVRRESLEGEVNIS
ncbi:hypothetical protein [Sphingomonas sp. PB4P5]|uniref:hypothetical protein n=1 Tax=Parasphingomonas puruogangriensis TaxID=3096155 RepID=UPI002FC975E9